MKSFKETEFVIFDVETTGLSPRAGDRILEIAALKIRDLKPVDSFCSFVNPEREIAYGAFLINKITQEMVGDAPTSAEVLPEFMDFCGDACLVGHNIKFDISFLTNELSLVGQTVREDVLTLDTVKMARGLLPELGRYSLWYVAQALSVDTAQQHRAMADVEMTFDVFRKLLEIADRKDICDTELLLNLYGNNAKREEGRVKKQVSIIKEAIDLEKTLDLVYSGINSLSLTMRKVTPKSLVGSGSNTKMVGFCHLRGGERSFKVSRIIRLNTNP